MEMKDVGEILVCPTCWLSHSLTQGKQLHLPTPMCIIFKVYNTPDVDASLRYLLGFVNLRD